MIPVKAMYHEGELPEYRGNPFIECLPLIKTAKDIFLSLHYIPECNGEQRLLPQHLRKKYLHRIEHLLSVTPECIEVFQSIENAIYQGYIPRLPFSPSTQHYLHHVDYDTMKLVPAAGRYRPKGRALSVIGTSGSGKTHMLESILGTFNQIIDHEKYQNQPLHVRQIVWLKVDCPNNTTVWGLVCLLLDEIARVTGNDELSAIPRRSSNIEMATVRIELQLRNYFTGILVVDEIQNLKLGNDPARDQFLNFLLRLINRSGIPVVLCGNPEIVKILTKTLRLARRSESGGYHSIEAMSPEVWEIYAEELWHLQWTNPPTPYTEYLSRKLYTLSTGLPDFATRIFIRAQELLIGEVNETISEEVLDAAYVQTCVLTEEALSSRREQFLATIRDSIAGEDNICDDLNVTEQYETPESPSETDNVTKIADINRNQHIEFEKRQAILRKNYCALPPSFDKNLLRRSGDHKDPLKYLIENNAVLTDFSEF